MPAMTPKQRMEAALSGGPPPDKVPVWELGFYCIDAATGRGPGEGDP